MNFGEYVAGARTTRSCSRAPEHLLGLASEAGSICNVYKKYLRDHIDLDSYREFLLEELGDLLWYIAMVADVLGVDLDDAAIANLASSRALYKGTDFSSAVVGGKISLERFQHFALETSIHGKAHRPESTIAAVEGLLKHVGLALDLHKQDAQAKNSEDRRGMRELKDNVPSMSHEIGAMLWYTAVIASAYDFPLEQVATKNLERTRLRYNDGVGLTAPNFDAGYKDWEVFPRRIIIEFSEIHEAARRLARLDLVHATPNAFPDGPIDVGGKERQGFSIGQQLGDHLTDNSRRADGYRYHDAIHMAFMAVLHWSPVMRVMLHLKRKSNADTDEKEDGARAQFTEEAIAAALAGFATRRIGFEKPQTVDGEVLDVVKIIAAEFEVKAVAEGLWRSAISQGFAAMKELDKNAGGYLTADLDAQSVTYSKHRPISEIEPSLFDCALESETPVLWEP